MKYKVFLSGLVILFSLSAPILASDVKSECKDKDINACNQWVEQESSSESYFYRAYAKAINHDAEGALADYDKAIELNPNDFKLYANRADIKLFFEEYDSAVVDLDKAIELEPNNPNLYKIRSKIKELAGNTSSIQTASSPQNNQSLPILGRWQIDANNYTGILEISGNSRSLSAKIYYDVAKKWETLADISYNNTTGDIRFRRPWSGNPDFQKYSGKISGNSISGSFKDNNTPNKTYYWKGTKLAL